MAKQIPEKESIQPMTKTFSWFPNEKNGNITSKQCLGCFL